MKKLFSHPLFVLGLFVKIAFIYSINPVAITEWYGPFLENSIRHFSMDPWSEWLSLGGAEVAFPYGYAMWLFFLPFIYIGTIAGFSIKTAILFAMLSADILVLLILNKFASNKLSLLIYSYWLSPIIFFATYVYGFNDLVPVLLLLFSLLSVKVENYSIGAIALAAAISAKLSMVIGLPIILIYLFKNKFIKHNLFKFSIVLLLSSAIFWIPFLGSKNAVLMLFNNPEIIKIYQLSVSLTSFTSVYLIPLLYLLMVYVFWRIRRINYQFFLTTLCITFFSIALFIPASPGWFVWSIPLLVLHQEIFGRASKILLASYSFLYVASSLLILNVYFGTYYVFNLSEILNLKGIQNIFIVSMLHTLMVGIGLILIYRIWIEAVHNNIFFKIARKPLVIGIAGDSGSGKDTLADALINVFGRMSVVKISGDDYHLWDRKKPIWQVITHLNPLANNLEKLRMDLLGLITGDSILINHYDHATGMISKPFKVRSNDFIIASGLHTFYLPIIRDLCNIKIYLDIDEGLRTFLKVRRDVRVRGYDIDSIKAQIQKRIPDSSAFIAPQEKFSDITFRLEPISGLENFSLSDKNLPPLRLIVYGGNYLNNQSLIRVLLGIYGLYVDVKTSTGSKGVIMIIEGNIDGVDISSAAKILCKTIYEFVDPKCQWSKGELGLMQLISLYLLDQTISRRLFNEN